MKNFLYLGIYASVAAGSTTLCPKTASVSEAVTAINNAYQDPITACFWWKLKTQGYSPQSLVSGWQMDNGCSCILYAPKRAKTTLPIGHEYTKVDQIVKHAVANATEFCDFWQQGLNNDATPFMHLGPPDVDTACKSILRNTTQKKNYIRNPYFAGSGRYQQVPGYAEGNTLVMPSWFFGGAWVSNEGALQNWSVGNSMDLSVYSDSSESIPTFSYLQQSQISVPVPGNYTLAFDSAESCSAPPCNFLVTWGNEALWNETTVSESALSKAPIRRSFHFATSKNFPSNTVVTFNLTSFGDWYISNVALTPL